MPAPARKRLEPVPDDDNQDKTEQKDAPDKVVDAAKGEVVEEAKTVEWEGLTFAIPREIPAVFLMDQVSMESSSDMTGMIRLLHTILGDEQFTQARNRVVEVSDKNSMDDQVQHIVDLLNTVLNSYGTDQGEASASSDSSENAGN